jgi:DNA-binding response OmpR family regulator
MVRQGVPVLVVDDNTVLAAALSKGLREDGFEVEVAHTGAAALARIAHLDADAIVLDLGLPDVDGLTVLDRTRALGVHAPVLVLTARDAVRARIDALERGADDYLTKPYQYAELLARLRALVRRASGPRWAPLTCNGLVLREDTLAVTIRGESVTLSPREHALLAFLLRRKGEVFSRKEILQEVFGYHFEPGTNIVNVHVSNLRKKLGASAVVIETVRSLGYRLEAARDGKRA